MPAMKDALNEAGITVPLNKRVWLWLKDHPKKGSGDIANALNAPDGAVATQVKDMTERRMLTRTEEPRRLRGGGRGGGTRFVERYVGIYEVNPMMRGEFELLPKPKKTPASEKATRDIPAGVVDKIPKATPTWTPETAVTGLSLTQCRELFNYLHKIFKE